MRREAMRTAAARGEEVQEDPHPQVLGDSGYAIAIAIAGMGSLVDDPDTGIVEAQDDTAD